MSHCADHNPEDRNDVSKIIEKFDQYSIGELHETFERYNFNSRNQEETEGIDTYGPIVYYVSSSILGCWFHKL